jgi:hypothetical protein
VGHPPPTDGVFAKVELSEVSPTLSFLSETPRLAISTLVHRLRMKTMATNLDLRKQEIDEICLDSSESSLAEHHEKPRQKRLAWHMDRLSRTKEIVLLDPKEYGNNPEDDTGSKVYERVKELARMLHNLEPAASDESGPRTLKCKG